eukprot:CAMPEP_0169131800 /NCGR_PEP_ID=MMETSP1015-20121227/38448_1 /TAXON_ID=342587 /ORGANISM="Karlodinium micrum, Strain CCMP2283" /LENGTH=108 /DNA_ID=CAMNT_0009196101 /DNA_START=95 /DNA_END=421 /DNA_ORIENTATION=+
MAKRKQAGDQMLLEKSALNKKLVETGDRERLKQFIKTSLNECKWREELKAHSIEYIQQKGIEKVTLQDITSAIAPKAREKIPEELKTELFNRLRTLSEQYKLDAPDAK